VTKSRGVLEYKSNIQGDVDRTQPPTQSNPATPAGYPEGNQPETKVDTKGPIREIKGFGEKT
jgi:hypothetical protein